MTHSLSPLQQHFTDVPCTACECVCDDLDVTVAENRIVEAKRACPLAETWFASINQAAENPRPTSLIDGHSVDQSTAITRAAEILSQCQVPLIFGLNQSSVTGVRAAIELAEQLGAIIDPAVTLSRAGSLLAMHQVGISTCSLGEVRHRADLVICWGTDPVTTHPRHLERYSLDPTGEFLPGGRADRMLVVVDTKPTPTSALADLFIQISAESTLESLWGLRQLVQGESPSNSTIDTQLVELANLMKTCQYGAMFFDFEMEHDDHKLAHIQTETLFRLVRELNDFTRFTANPMSSSTGWTTAASVLTWQTGFPFAVNFSQGAPRYSPSEWTANTLLERAEVDACLIVGSEAISLLSPQAQDTLRQLPTIVLDPPTVTSPLPATVEFTTAIPGVHCAETGFRMDGVTLPLQQLLDSEYSTDAIILAAIGKML